MCMLLFARKEDDLAAVRCDCQRPTLRSCPVVRTGADKLVCQGRLTVRPVLGRADTAENLFEVEGAQTAPQNEQAEDETGVADAVGNERLVRGVGSALPLEIETDQQIRTDADQL